MKVKHHLFAILGLDIDCIIGCIKSFFVDFFDIRKGDVEVVKSLVFECLCTHVIIVFSFMRWMEYYEALLFYTNIALNDC